MADLLYGCVGVDGRRKRKQREFRSIGFTIDGYTDEELRARYRFGKESIEYITDLLADNLRRKTNRNHQGMDIERYYNNVSIYKLTCFKPL